MTAPLLFLVEPDPLLAEAFEAYLEHYGYRTRIVGASEVLAASEVPDLIIGEHPLHLPEGRVLCDVLKEDVRTAGIPFLAVTARAMPAEVSDARMSHAAGVLVKPVRLHRLLEAVERLVGEAAPRSPMGAAVEGPAAEESMQ
jgi:CheY-like chemotaxis protein